MFCTRNETNATNCADFSTIFERILELVVIQEEIW